MYGLQEDAMRWCLTALFMAAVCLTAAQASAERRVALVVGNSQYEHTPALSNPRNDAEDIADALKKVGFEVEVGYDLDQVRFASLIDDFARALEGADVGLFFYAGHGLQIDDRNYLVSTQAKLESTFLVASETIELDAVIRLMESKTRTNLVFLDACRNNPLTENLKRNLAATNRAATVSRGLAPVKPGSRDTLVVYSAAPGEVAADGTGRNSPFAASLLRHLPEAGLEISVMLKDVTADVRQETNNGQRPQQLSDMSRKFYFVNPDAPAVPAQPAITPPPAGPAGPAAPPSDPVEVAFWQSASAANECESIRAYISQYPKGSFAALAVIRERQLCKPGPETAVAPPQTAPGPAPDATPATTPAAQTADAAALRGLLGVSVQRLTDEIGEVLNIKPARGVLVADVDDKGPAKKAGIESGDVIIRFDGKDTKEMKDLPIIVSATPFGKEVEVIIIRKGREESRAVKLGRLEVEEKPTAPPAANPAPSEMKVLGLNLANLTDELRRQYKIKDTVKGVVIVSIDAQSPVSDWRRNIGEMLTAQSVGEVLTEVSHEPVADIVAVQKKIDRLKADGRRWATLTIVSPDGYLRFVEPRFVVEPPASAGDQPAPQGPARHPAPGRPPGGRGRR
jgi:uncharacterized caspase-like protein